MEIWSISVSLRSQNKFRLQWVNFLPLILFTHSQKTKGHYTTGRPRTEGKPQPPSGSGSALAHMSDRPAVEAPAPIRFLRFCHSEIVLCLKHSWWVYFLLKDPHTKIGRLAPASRVPAFTVTMQITTWHTLDLAVNTLPTPHSLSLPPTTPVLLKCLSLWERVSWAQIDLCVAENDYEFLILLPPPSKWEDYRYSPPCTVYAVSARFRPSASAMPVNIVPTAL